MLRATRTIYNLKRALKIYFLLSILFSGSLVAQINTEIKDIINKYTKVTSIVDANSVNVTSSADFNAGDTVMIAQMKGAIYSAFDPNVIDNPLNMGKYEFTVVASVSGNEISFNSPLKNSYDAGESVQLIRVPGYEDATVINKLTCAGWDGEKGGILAFMVSGTLSLKADIDVSGKGFRGGDTITFASGKCFATSGTPFSLFKILNVHADSTSGRKGEGAITNKFLYTLGKGPSGNGGGGGTGSYSGGGGGGSYGIGGNGAKESCSGEDDLNWGGNGGSINAQYFSNNITHRRIYLGGGGGSGIQKVSKTGTSGGNGGGIIIILTPHIITNNYAFRANGGDVTKFAADGSSSGGGGGGGMVLLAADSVKNNLIVSVKGGKGGSSASGAPCNGQGGGGGGGFVWFSGKELNFSQLDLSGGEAGTGSCDVSSTPGQAGDSLNRLLLPLTGFLNNSLTGETKTCYNTRQLIKGSRPQGGNGVYTYLWQYRNYGSTTWTAAPGRNDTIDYLTPFLTDTTQFQRTVISDGMVDNSKVFTIKVFPQITNNTVNPDTTVCFGAPSIKIRGTVAGGGIGNILYSWSQRTVDGSWEPASGVNTEKDYFATTDDTRYYLRKVTSDYCSIYDSVKLDVLPLISNNIIVANQTICYNLDPLPLSGNMPEGGNGSYTYNWQKSTDEVNWSDIETTKDFTPPALTQSTFYRRITMSGLRNCCTDTSDNVKITVLPNIVNNSIAGQQTICEKSAPELFTGSAPGGGDTNEGYRYQWESSKDGVLWDSLDYSAALKDFKAKEQDTTLRFRRAVFSGLNDCCKSLSNEITVTVQPEIENNIITGDTTICENTVPAPLKGIFPDFKGGDGITYYSKWEEKKSGANWTDIAQSNNLLSYQPPALFETVSYKRVITSGVCTHFSAEVTINVLKKIEGNTITGNSAVCEGFPAGMLDSNPLSGGQPGEYRIQWQKSEDASKWENLTEQNNIGLLPGILPHDLYFRRIVTSGPYDCCLSYSNNHKISIDKKPHWPEAGANRELVYQDTAYLRAMPLTIGEGHWSTSSEAYIETPANPVSKVSDMKFGEYVFYWTVTNGVCPTVKDSVVLTLNDLHRYTGFSPNGDGINDYFVVEGLENAGAREITIINRWGVEVFHTSDYENDWDGRNKNGESLPEDTYYYILKVDDVFNPGKQRIYKGYVVIKR